MKWEEEYKRKLVSAADAAKVVKSGDTVLMALALGEPSFHLVDALIARRDELRGVKIISTVQIRPFEWYEPGMEESFLMCPQFGTTPIWKAMAERRTDYLPATSTTLGYMLEQGWIPVDVFVNMVTPPNKQGYINLGLTNFYSMEAIKAAKMVIAEVNDQMPTVYGDNWVHVSQFDYFVEHSSPIPEVKRETPGEIEETIAQHTLELIHDRDTFQMGVGAIPEAIASKLGGRHDLGVITEMFPTGLPALVRKGIVTNKYKSVHKGKTVATFCMGEREMYEYVDHNPECEFYPGQYTNDYRLLASHDNLVAINGTLEVDLKGQVCSESVGVRQVSGTGGQFDFMMGSYYSPGGRGINVMHSTYHKEDGTVVSRIVPTLTPGASVTVPLNYTQYVITEYGIASLRGKTFRQRAEELIAIAHPDSRPWLREEARRFFRP